MGHAVGPQWCSQFIPCYHHLLVSKEMMLGKTFPFTSSLPGDGKDCLEVLRMTRVLWTWSRGGCTELSGTCGKMSDKK